MKNASEAILKPLKQKLNSRCQNDKKREDAEQKYLPMTPCFAKGFTLIELLVVVLIIGILSAVALPQYQAAVEKSRVAQVFPNIKSIQQGHLYYFQANQEWPSYAQGGMQAALQSVGFDLTGGSWYSDSIYKAKDFAYRIGQTGSPMAGYTGPHNAYLDIYRIQDGKYDASNNTKTNKDYRLRVIIYSDGKTEQSCFYKANLGKRVCASLPGEWTLTKTSSGFM